MKGGGKLRYEDFFVEWNLGNGRTREMPIQK